MEKIRIGIVGYGNLGKGVEKAVKQNPDIELAAIFTRRPAAQLDRSDNDIMIVNTSEAEDYVGKIDVAILCGGSATDLPEQGPEFAKLFNTVDSYDTHARIPEYYNMMDKAARENGNTSAISVGWDQGFP